MRTIIYGSALALLATVAACSQSNEQQGTLSSNTGAPQSAQCSPYDPQCRISQAPGLNNLLPPGSISQQRQIPMTQ